MICGTSYKEGTCQIPSIYGVQMNIPFVSVRTKIWFRFRSIRSFFPDPVPVRFRSNTDQIDRIWLSPGKNVILIWVSDLISC